MNAAAPATTVTAFENKYAAVTAGMITTTAGQLTRTTGGALVETLDSQTFDTGAINGAGFNALWWNGTKPAGMTVRLWLATSTSASGPWTYKGSTCSDYPLAGYEPAPDAPVVIGCASTHWNKRYFRYRVGLCSTSDCSTTSSATPTVQDITVNWSR